MSAEKKNRFDYLLETWGEVIITMASGKVYEVHKGDNMAFGPGYVEITLPDRNVTLFFSDMESIDTHLANEA